MTEALTAHTSNEGGSAGASVPDSSAKALDIVYELFKGATSTSLAEVSSGDRGRDDAVGIRR